MEILHISAECYPAAKVGGLADVVGSLPKYLNKQGLNASVIMPKYGTEWLNDQSFRSIYEGYFIWEGDEKVEFEIRKVEDGDIEFPLFVVKIPEYFDTPDVYGGDEARRFIAFQRAVLAWLVQRNNQPDLLHCHDHHTSLIPFMTACCPTYASLADIPTVLTVHNAEYQGAYGHEIQQLLPNFNITDAGLLEWNGALNSLAAGLKCCWQITTVSPSYMKELTHRSSGLEYLFADNQYKSLGILNGIDTDVWDPAMDPFLDHHFDLASVQQGKGKNKEQLCQEFELNPDRPLISFIGRLAYEKGADLLPDLFSSIIKEEGDASFIVLGTGDRDLHARFDEMSNKFVGFFDASLNYNEKLAHQIYAGSDFLIMPSRVEPCGLNQMYAMHYGTVPVVHRVGGLKDTVKDISKPDGCGIGFEDFRLEAAIEAINRARLLYQQKEQFFALRKKIMQLDFSWNASAKKYITMYKELTEEGL